MGRKHAWLHYLCAGKLNGTTAQSLLGPHGVLEATREHARTEVAMSIRCTPGISAVLVRQETIDNKGHDLLRGNLLRFLTGLWGAIGRLKEGVGGKSKNFGCTTLTFISR